VRVAVRRSAFGLRVGAWWPVQAHGLAHNANPALTFKPNVF
jgi:hypothetical protein